MARHPHIAYVADVPEEALRSPEGTFFGGSRRRIGAAIGAQRLGYGVFAIPPGKTAFPFHGHGVNEEMIHVLEGHGTLRFGTERIAVEAGAFIACPAGRDLPHQLINDSDGVLRYLVVSTMSYPDIVDYPDSEKVGVYAGPSASAGEPFRALFERKSAVPYFHGESGGRGEGPKT